MVKSSLNLSVWSRRPSKLSVNFDCVMNKPTVVFCLFSELCEELTEEIMEEEEEEKPSHAK